MSLGRARTALGSGAESRNGAFVPSVFHAVPSPMVGSVLYPLTELERVDREAWRRARSKYAGREHVLELRVPPLNCMWNDVLHLSTVHPAEIWHELRDAGLQPPPRRFFEFDAADFDARRTVIFASDADSVASQWMSFDQAALAGLSALNDASRRYYRACAADGTRPLVWAYLPHVLHDGPLDTCGTPIIAV